LQSCHTLNGDRDRQRSARLPDGLFSNQKSKFG
jgi:hypothetical protein